MDCCVLSTGGEKHIPHHFVLETQQQECIKGGGDSSARHSLWSLKANKVRCGWAQVQEEGRSPSEQKSPAVTVRTLQRCSQLYTAELVLERGDR